MRVPRFERAKFMSLVVARAIQFEVFR